MEPAREPLDYSPRLGPTDLLPDEYIGTDIAGALQLVARREHTLFSLSELSQELTISLDLFSLTDLALFSLMGQVGTSHSALWLVSGQGETPVLVRGHGINKQVAKALGSAYTSRMIDALASESRPRTPADLENVLDAPARRLVERARIELFAAVRSRQEVLGIIVLGPRIDGQPYGAVELQGLQAALGMVGVAIQNMTYYSRMLENNRQLRLAYEDLKSLDKLKSEFLSNINHELRTPLSNIIAYVDCLMDAKADKEHAQDFLKVVMQEALKLKGLLENLLAFHVLSQEKMTLQLTSGDVTVPLARYYEERLPGVTEGLREFVYSWEPDLPHATYDETRMLQIVDALVENAVKFTPQGSRIQLRARLVSDFDQRWIRIEIEDDGPGISSDRLPFLFESFRQVDGTSTRSVGGMGMGLSFAHQIAQRMGGQLTVASEIGRGSLFTLHLPLAH